MKQLAESAIEQTTLNCLTATGWATYSGTEIAPGMPAAERDNYGQARGPAPTTSAGRNVSD